MTSEYPNIKTTIECSADKKNIWSALFKFQGSTQGVVRDSTNPHFRNKYASLEAVIDVARPGLQAVGIVFLQAPGGYVDGCFAVETMLVHPASAEWIRFTTSAPLAKADPQGVGSATTYFSRYALMACLGLPPLDDDGEATRRQDRSVPPPLNSTKTMVTDSLAVSDSQLTELENLILKSGAHRDRFLLAMNVEALADLPVSEFERAKDKLNQKLKEGEAAVNRARMKNGGNDARR